jgi:hypothetical protein
VDDQQLEAIRIITRCTTRDQFIAMFRRFCKPTSCFIPSQDSRPIGLATAFSIRLADGTPLLKGEGVVLDAWTTADNPFKRPGIQLGIHRLDDSCTKLFEELLVPRTGSIEPLSPKIQLSMLFARSQDPMTEIETPTVEMAPMIPPDEQPVPGAPDVLPANPLMDMDDAGVAAFIDCTLTPEQNVPESIANDATIPHAVPPPKPVTTRRMWSRDTIPEPMRVSNRDIIATLLGMQPLQARTKPRTLTDLAPPPPPRPPAPVVDVIDEPLPQLPSAFGRWWIPATLAATMLACAAWFIAV